MKLRANRFLFPHSGHFVGLVLWRHRDCRLFSLLFPLFFHCNIPSLGGKNGTTKSFPCGSGFLAPLSSPAILQIPIHGVIGDPQKLNAEVFQNVLLDSRTGL